MLVFVGLSHRSAPLSLRERCAVPAGERERAAAELHRQLGPAVLLSTCGRTELYLDHPDAERAEHEAVRWLAHRARISPEQLLPHLDVARDSDTVRRAVRVACGLESAVEGENEIAGQVRRAWLNAAHLGTLSPALNTLFILAMRTARQARRIGDPNALLSLADAAAARVAERVRTLPSPRVVVAGTGPMGLRAARALRHRFGPALELTLVGRTPERFLEHAQRLDAQPRLLDRLSAALTTADAAVIALRTQRVLVEPAQIADRDRARRLLIVDLSMPRAVEAAAGSLPGVSLLNVDALRTERGLGRWDGQERARVELLVDAAVAGHKLQSAQADGGAALAALRLRAEGVRQRQVERTLRRLPQVDGEVREAMNALTRAIVNQLLHAPTVRLRDAPDGASAQQILELFGCSDSTAQRTCATH